MPLCGGFPGITLSPPLGHQYTVDDFAHFPGAVGPGPDSVTGDFFRHEIERRAFTLLFFRLEAVPVEDEQLEDFGVRDALLVGLAQGYRGQVQGPLGFERDRQVEDFGAVDTLLAAVGVDYVVYVVAESQGGGFGWCWHVYIL